MSDHQELSAIERRLTSAAKKLQDSAPMLGHARTIKEYNSEQRRALLSRLVAKFLIAGDSVSAAEHKARALPEYGSGIATLQSGLEEAEKTIADYSATEAAWETARSLVSLMKEQMKL